VPPPARAARRLQAYGIDLLVAAVPAGFAAAAAAGAAAAATDAAMLQILAGVAGFVTAMSAVMIGEVALAGTTAGAAARHLAVVGPDGARAGRGRLVKRELARLGLIHLPSLVAGAGLAGVAPCAGRGRAWHDVASGCTVLAADAPDLRLFAATRTRRYAPSGAEYASFSERTGAFLIDFGFVVTAWGTVLGIVALTLNPLENDADPPNWFVAVALISLPVVDLVYGVTALAWRGTTIGLGAVGFVVRRAVDEGDIPFGRAVGRELVRCLIFVSMVTPIGWVLFPLDRLSPLWQGRRQTLHDRAGGTVVVRGEPRPWRSPRPAPATTAEPVAA
jgi:uncharacterized RDD family membrane protein YckC